MAVGILVMLFVHGGALPEMWDGFYNHKSDPASSPIFPMMFVSIACGAISGFHATQSPMMAVVSAMRSTPASCSTGQWLRKVLWLLYGLRSQSLSPAGIPALRLRWRVFSCGSRQQSLFVMAWRIRRHSCHIGSDRRPYHFGRHCIEKRTPDSG